MRARFFYGIIIIVFVWLLMSPAKIMAQGADSASANINQPAVMDTTKKADAVLANPGFNQDTMMKMLYYGGQIGYFTIFVMMVGIFLILQKTFQLKSDSKDSAWVIRRVGQINLDNPENLSQLDQALSEIRGKHTEWKLSESHKITNIFKSTFEGVGNFIYTVANVFGKKSKQNERPEAAAKTTLFGLFSKLNEVYKATHNTDAFNSEVGSYLQYLKDKFNPFLVQEAFLSSTAGALGLLGTVWGMFLTFFSGSMEQSEIIQGMGVALATTIIGIVVSLVLDTFTTMVNNKFNAHIELVTKIANNFQVSLMRWTAFEPEPAPVVVVQAPPAQKQKTTTEFSEKKEQVKPAYRIPETIEIRTRQNLRCPVNSQLPEPVQILVKDAEGYPMDGVPVTFVVDEDSGLLNGGPKTEIVRTKDGGYASINWKLGPSAGKKMLRITADGLQHKTERFVVEAIPEKPEQLLELTGNFQAGRTGEFLRDPFVVRVLDQFKNPVPGCVINFSVKEGQGNFKNCKAGEVNIETDDRGIAEAQFQLGNQRGSVKINCSAKQMKDSLAFQVFAQ